MEWNERHSARFDVPGDVWLISGEQGDGVTRRGQRGALLLQDPAVEWSVDRGEDGDSHGSTTSSASNGVDGAFAGKPRYRCVLARMRTWPASLSAARQQRAASIDGPSRSGSGSEWSR